jgi:hypothetical protein
LLFEPVAALVTAQWPQQEGLPRVCAELLAHSPVFDHRKSDAPLTGYTFPPALVTDHFGIAAYFVVAHELLLAADAPGYLGWARTWELVAKALACREFAAARDVLDGTDVSLLCAVLTWWLLRERQRTGTLALPVPGHERLIASWEPVPERVLPLAYQLTNLWLHFPAAEWGALGRTALAACSRLPLELGATHLRTALGADFRLPPAEWAFAQLYLEGVHNQHFAIPDELTLQVSDGPFREVRLWSDGHGAMLAALGLALPGAEERLAYTWVGLRAVADQVEAWTSCSSLAGADPEETATAAFAATLVAGAFRDAAVLEVVPCGADRAANQPAVSAAPRSGRCQIRYLARRAYERGTGWGPVTAGRTQLQAAGVLKRVAQVRGYFVRYQQGQVPDPERLQRLAGAGIVIPAGRSDYRSAHRRLIYSATETEYRSRSALQTVLGAQAQVLAHGTIRDWRVAQISVADKLTRLGFAVENRYYRDKGIDIIAVGSQRLAVQVKATARGVKPGDVRDFDSAVATLREQLGACTALLVGTVGPPSREALALAAKHGIACLHHSGLDQWLAGFAGVHRTA